MNHETPPLFVNVTALRTDLDALESELRALKSQLRRTWTRSMSAEQARLCSLKYAATRRYCLLAATRGRRHLADPERNERLARSVADEYAAPAQVAEMKVPHAVG